MATLTGKIADVTSRTPENISSITVKAPSARIGGGTDVIVSSPAEVTFDKTTGDITISGLTGGLSWLYIEGDGWSDSIPLSVAEGMITLVEAVANASGAPGMADYIRLLAELETRIDSLAQDAVDEAAENIQWFKGFIDDTHATMADVPIGLWGISASTHAGRLGLPADFGTLQVMPMGSSRAAFFIGRTIGLYINMSQDDVWGEWHQPWAEDKWHKGVITSDHQTMADVGVGVWNVAARNLAVGLGLPMDYGSLQVMQIGLSKTAFFIGQSTGFWINSSDGDAWGEWQRPAGSGGGGGGGGAAGLKTVGMALTAGSLLNGVAGRYRVLTQVTAPVVRWRVHVESHRMLSNTTSAFTLGDVYVGNHSGDGAMVGQQQIKSGNLSVPAGGEWESPWLDASLLADETLIDLSVSGSDLYWLQATSWVYEGGKWVSSKNSPVSIWVELETYDQVPVVGMIGDSTGAGQGADRPVFDSALYIAARKHKFIPMAYTYPGSSMQSINDYGFHLFQRWAHLDKPDSVIIQSGSNDIHTGASTAEIRTRFADLVETAEMISPVVIGSTVKARYPDSGEHQTSLNSHNDFVKTRVNGNRDYLDFYQAVSPSGTVASADAADAAHLSTSGHQKLATAFDSVTVSRPAVIDAGDFTTHDYVDSADQSLGQRIDNEKWRRGRLNPVTLASLDDAPEGYGYVATTANATTYGLPEDMQGAVVIETYNSDGWGITFQKATAYFQYQARIAIRVFSGGQWFDWRRVDANSLREELDTKTSANLGSAPSLGLSTLDDAPEGFITVDTVTQAKKYSLPDYLEMPAVIHTLKAGSTKLQTAWGYSAMQGRVAVRYYSGTRWYDWSRTDANWVQAELDKKADSGHTHPELEQLITGGTAGGAGTKIVPLALTAPGGSNSVLTQDSGAVRIVRSWAHNPYRVRVHISNKNPANRTFRDNIGASLQLISAQADGTIEGTTSLGYITIPGEGEWVSGWVDVPNPESNWVGINAAWSGQTSKTQQLLQGGGWTKTPNDGWTDTQTTDWEWVTETPFYIWFEAEAPANAPVIMVNGDSISIGTVTSNPVQDSWVAIHARERGALPLLMSQHGSGMSWWGTNSTRWDDMYPGVDVRPDAIITALGQNDLPSRDLEWQKTYYAELNDVYSTRWPGIPVYAASITPSNKESDLEVQRRDFNDWAKSAPHGERGYLDVAAPIATADDEDVKPEYAADHVHPNTAGMALMSKVLGKRPVTSYVIPEKAIGGSTQQPQIIATSTATLAGWSVWNLPFGREGVSVSENGDIYTPAGRWLVDIRAVGGTITNIRTYGSENIDHAPTSARHTQNEIVTTEGRIRVAAVGYTSMVIVLTPLP